MPEPRKGNGVSFLSNRRELSFTAVGVSQCEYVDSKTGKQCERRKRVNTLTGKEARTCTLHSVADDPRWRGMRNTK